MLNIEDIWPLVPFSELPHPFLTRAMKFYYKDSKYFKLLKFWWFFNAPQLKTFDMHEGEAQLFEYFEWNEDDRSLIDTRVWQKGIFSVGNAKLWLLLSKKFPKE
jgi:hypothetical protein